MNDNLNYRGLNSVDDVEQLMISTLNELYKNDNDLFDFDEDENNMISERTITFRIGYYWINKFEPRYKVDCEYNRKKQEIKKLPNLDGDMKDFNPDIIIHNRQQNNNLLVLEAKKRIKNSRRLYINKFKEDVNRIKNAVSKGCGYDYKFGVGLIIGKRFDECAFYIWDGYRLNWYYNFDMNYSNYIEESKKVLNLKEDKNLKHINLSDIYRLNY